VIVIADLLLHLTHLYMINWDLLIEIQIEIGKRTQILALFSEHIRNKSYCQITTKFPAFIKMNQLLLKFEGQWVQAWIWI